MLIAIEPDKLPVSMEEFPVSYKNFDVGGYTLARRAQRNFAGVERGLALRSSGEGRMTL